MSERTEVRLRRAGLKSALTLYRRPLLSGLLLAFSFPPFHLLIPLLVGLVPLLFFIDAVESRRRLFWGGFWMGVVFYGLLLYWFLYLIRFTPLILVGYLFSVVYLASLMGVLILLVQVLHHRLGIPYLVAVPGLWAFFEYLRSLGDLGFTWGGLAYGLTGYPLLLQPADLVGPYGIAGWVAAVNVLVFSGLRWWKAPGPRRWVLVGLGAAFLLPLSYGLFRWRSLTVAREVRVSLVQPNIPQEVKMEARARAGQLTILEELSREGMARRPDLLVWPETAIPTFLANRPDLIQWVEARVQSYQTPLLLGALDYDRLGADRFQIYNAAFLVEETGLRNPSYRKIFLVPATEKIPFQEALGFLERLSPWLGSFSPGTDYTVFALPGFRLSTMICFESIFPGPVRRFRQAGAEMVIDITNDAWFGRSFAPYQHFAFLVLRAIETRTPMLQAANTGITGFVDPWGRAYGLLPVQEPGVTTQPVPLVEGETVYGRYGDWVLFLFAGTLGVWGVVSWLRRKSNTHAN